jgi:hypothetical protein
MTDFTIVASGTTLINVDMRNCFVSGPQLPLPRGERCWHVSTCLRQDAAPLPTGAVPPSQGFRSSAAFPVSKSVGTEQWSCMSSHLPLIF